MKKIIVLVLTTLFIITSCTDSTSDKVDPEKSKMKTELANHAFTKALKIVKEKTETTECSGDDCNSGIENPEDMDSFDFTNAYNLYNEAIEADPGNLDAQLGAAISRILALLKDPEFIKLRNAWWNVNNNFDLDSASLTEARLKFSNFINNAFIPAIDYSLDRMAILDKPENKNYVYLITPEFYDETEGDTFELDMTEIKAFHAILLSVKAGTNLTQAYKIDLNDYSLEGIKNALTKGSNFLTLLNAGKMVSAHNKANEAVNKALDAIEFLLAETDDQDNDLIKNTAKTVDNIYKFKDNLLKIKDALNNPYELKNNGIALSLTISNFFNNAPTDLKALLPDYTVSIENNELKVKLVAENRVSLIFPDTTFGGLLAGNPSQEDIKLFTEIYECSANVSCYDGDPYYHCTKDFTCKYGKACSTDTECETYEHCGTDNYCANGTRCSEDSNCSSGEHCSTENICEYGKRCSNDTDCDSNETCNTDSYCEWAGDK